MVSLNSAHDMVCTDAINQHDVHPPRFVRLLVGGQMGGKRYKKTEYLRQLRSVVDGQWRCTLGSLREIAPSQRGCCAINLLLPIINTTWKAVDKESVVV